jgi:hypothetical protein
MRTTTTRISLAFTALAVVLLVAGCALVPWIGDLPRSSPGPFGTPGTSPSPTAITRDEAIEIARAHAEQFADGDVLEAQLGTFADLGSDGDFGNAPPVPAPNEPVWRVTLGYDHGPLNAAGEVFVILASDGRLVQQYSWIA